MYLKQKQTIDTTATIARDTPPTTIPTTVVPALPQMEEEITCKQLLSVLHLHTTFLITIYMTAYSPRVLLIAHDYKYYTLVGKLITLSSRKVF